MTTSQIAKHPADTGASSEPEVLAERLMQLLKSYQRHPTGPTAALVVLHIDAICSHPRLAEIQAHWLCDLWRMAAHWRRIASKPAPAEPESTCPSTRLERRASVAIARPVSA